MILENAPHGGFRDSVAEVGKRPLDASVSPRPILGGHAHDEITDLRINMRPSGAAIRRAVILGGDEFAMPAQNRVRRHDAAAGVEEPPSKCLALNGESPSLVVVQSNSLARKEFAKDAVFFTEVIDDSGLLTVEPSGERDHEEIPGIRKHGLRL